MSLASRRRWSRGVEGTSEYPVDHETRQIFRKALQAMNRSGVPYALGGAFGLHWYSGFWRLPKDLDFFLLEEQSEWAMQVLQSVGFVTRRKHPEWLAEGLHGDHKVDLIYGMGNWLDGVDPDYLKLAHRGTVLGVRTWILAPEEMIYSKAFVASRERSDAADVFHLLVATRGELDWPRLLGRFGENWEVLLSLLVLFRWVFPSHRDFVPDWLLDDLLSRFQQTRREPWTGGKLCRGYLLDGTGSYHLDVHEWGYVDAREEAWEREQRRREERRATAA